MTKEDKIAQGLTLNSTVSIAMVGLLSYGIYFIAQLEGSIEKTHAMAVSHTSNPLYHDNIIRDTHKIKDQMDEMYIPRRELLVRLNAITDQLARIENRMNQIPIEKGGVSTISKTSFNPGKKQ